MVASQPTCENNEKKLNNCVFQHQLSVRLYDTDAAGVLYFGSQFRLAHDAFETFMAQHGFPISIMMTEPYLLVVRHAQSDYTAPVILGDTVDIALCIERLGRTSFTCKYTFHVQETCVGHAKTVHVTIDRHTRKAVAMPDAMRAALHSYRRDT